MRQTIYFRCVAADPQQVGGSPVARIHYDRRNLPVRIKERGGKKLTAAGRAGNPSSAGLNELGKVADVVVRTQVSQLSRFRICMYGREAKIAHVIRAAPFIQ